MIKKSKEYSYLPNELFDNPKIDKRGKGELKKTIHVRITVDEHNNMVQLLNAVGITQSNFIRYAVKIGLADIEERIKNEIREEFLKDIEENRKNEEK